MRKILAAFLFLIMGCSPSWKESPYEVYFINHSKTLGYSVGEGSYIGRIDEPENIASNEKYLSVYACPINGCAYFYIDKSKDHKYADYDEFVYGPYSEKEFVAIISEFNLPEIVNE